MQKSYNYHFVSRWRVEATAQEVTDILDDALDLVRWWPDVYLEVKEFQKGDDDGIGQVYSLYTKGWLPYRLRWSFRVVESRPGVTSWGGVSGPSKKRGAGSTSPMIGRFGQRNLCFVTSHSSSSRSLVPITVGLWAEEKTA